MKLKDSVLLHYLDFDSVYCLLSLRNAKILVDYFQLLDVHHKNTLNDIQFFHFMSHVTDLKKNDIMLVFDMLDWDASGEIGFEEFYMVVCILLSCEYHVEKNFIFRHSRPVFELLDVDRGGSISLEEFKSSGFLFNLKEHALEKLFFELDYFGNKDLCYKEFKLFTMVCIDLQEEIKNKRREQRNMSLKVRLNEWNRSTSG